jgi:hypothetical protein
MSIPTATRPGVADQRRARPRTCPIVPVIAHVEGAAALALAMQLRATASVSNLAQLYAKTAVLAPCEK